MSYLTVGTIKGLGDSATYQSRVWESIPAPDLLSGADGALSINGTTVEIDAGDIKRYSSISIINSGLLRVRGWIELGEVYNTGVTPTIIGCSGNCTINTGGTIQLTSNTGNSQASAIGGETFSAPVVPFDAVVDPIQYTTGNTYGGYGGENGDASAYGDGDTASVGCGGGGAGQSAGDPSYPVDWGYSGQGGGGTAGAPGGSYYGVLDGSGGNGGVGGGGEVGTGTSYGAGGGGGGRGASGGMLYLQVDGTLSVSGVVINASGSSGGNGGDGGLAQSPDGPAYGGGGGGGGGGGNGGSVTIRYKAGSITALNINVDAGAGGLGGVGGVATDSGWGAINGQDGQPGTTGTAGTVDIATY